MELSKKRIENVVELYKRNFSDEYKIACDGIALNRKLMASESGEMNGTNTGRVVHEIPQKLYTALLQALTTEDLEYFKTKEGTRWFAKKFPEFSLISKI